MSEIKVYNFFEKQKKPLVVALGFFDCIHRGHVKLIDRAKKMASGLNAEAAVFTFTNDIRSVFSKNSDGLVLTFRERLIKLEELGIKNIIACEFNKDFAGLCAEQFLKILFDNFEIVGLVCGYDYTFGSGASGNVEILKDYCGKKSVEFAIVDEFILNGKRASTTLVKEYLKLGDVSGANNVLGYNYFMSGTVVSGRKQGRLIGFPTVNIIPEKDKFKLKHGVYKTRVIVRGKEYKAITNYGEQPTFGEVKAVVESHLKDFSDCVYGEEIIIIFDDYIRDIVKFSDTHNLSEQLKSDMEVLND